MDNDKLAALDKVSAAIKATEYKYFGDYEMSDDQREAVDMLVGVAEAYRAGELVPVTLDADTAGLVSALEAEGHRNGGQGAYAWKARELCCQAATALRTITAERDALAKRVGELEEGGRYILPYLDLTVSDGSPGYHPTMPSAVEAFRAALKGTDHG